jgi:hypothetical protein
MGRTLKATYQALVEALRVLVGHPDMTPPPRGTGGAIG